MDQPLPENSSVPKPDQVPNRTWFRHPRTVALAFAGVAFLLLFSALLINRTGKAPGVQEYTPKKTYYTIPQTQQIVADQVVVNFMPGQTPDQHTQDLRNLGVKSWTRQFPTDDPTLKGFYILRLKPGVSARDVQPKLQQFSYFASAEPNGVYKAQQTTQPTATPVALSCGYTPCTAQVPCQSGLVCVTTSGGQPVCALPSQQAACASNPSIANCCTATATSSPTSAANPSPTPTVTLVPPNGCCLENLGPNVVPNDPIYTDQWNLKKIGMEQAWNISKGNKNILIAELDSGINNYEDLPTDIVRGYNFANNNTDTTDNDGIHHGTGIAITIGALTNNNLDTSGINWNAKLLAVKVLGIQGGSTVGTDDMTAKGIMYAATSSAKIINLSLGGPQACSAATQAAVDFARQHGSLIIAAAGNENNSSVYSPSNCTGVISVGGTDENEHRAVWTEGNTPQGSNYGARVDIAAPAINIPIRIASQSAAGYEVETANGTSVSSAMVSAVASLIWSNNSSLTTEQVRNCILNNADPITTDHPIGGKRLNALRAMTACRAIPTPTPTRTPSPTPTTSPSGSVTATINPTILASSIPPCNTSMAPTSLTPTFYPIGGVVSPTITTFPCSSRPTTAVSSGTPSPTTIPGTTITSTNCDQYNTPDGLQACNSIDNCAFYVCQGRGTCLPLNNTQNCAVVSVKACPGGDINRCPPLPTNIPNLLTTGTPVPTNAFTAVPTTTPSTAGTGCDAYSSFSKLDQCDAQTNCALYWCHSGVECKVIDSDRDCIPASGKLCPNGNGLNACPNHPYNLQPVQPYPPGTVLHFYTGQTCPVNVTCIYDLGPQPWLLTGNGSLQLGQTGHCPQGSVCGSVCPVGGNGACLGVAPQFSISTHLLPIQAQAVIEPLKPVMSALQNLLLPIPLLTIY